MRSPQTEYVLPENMARNKANLKSLKIAGAVIRRIARGSGVKEKDVRELIGQWNRSRKMMKGMSGNRKMNKQMKRMMKDPDMDFDGLEM